LVETSDAVTKSKFVRFLDEKSDYISLRKTHLGFKRSAGARTLSVQETELIEGNEFLSSMLNEDGLIIIGEHYFKINLNSSKVYVLNIEFDEQINDLKEEKTDNKNILVFSTNDDVLYLIDEGSKGTINGRSQLFCRESNANGDKDDEFSYDLGDDLRQDNKVVYQSVGIYFSLQAKTKMQYKNILGLWVDAGVTCCTQKIEYYVKYEPKCKGVTERSGTKEDDGNSNELNYRPYESTRGLHKYRYEARFFGGGFWSRVYRIFDGF
jgi:hypothetical protein